MSEAIPFDEWFKAQGDDAQLAVCNGHPDTIILVDKTSLAVYRYVIDANQDGAHEALGELMRKRVHELGIEIEVPE